MLFVFIPLQALTFRGISLAWFDETQNVSFQMSYISSPGVVNYFPVFKHFLSAESVSHLSLLDIVLLQIKELFYALVWYVVGGGHSHWEDSFFRLLRKSSKVLHVLFHPGIFD